MDDKKQIEEILCFMDTNIRAKKIAELIPSNIVSYDGKSKGQHLYIEQKMEIAKEMMKQGAVVLTKEEYGRLKFIEKYGDIDIEAKTRKETAREFLYKLLDRLDDNAGYFASARFVAKEIAKSLGVEIKE